MTNLSIKISLGLILLNIYSCTQLNNQSSKDKVKCQDIKQNYITLFEEKPELKDSIISLIDKYKDENKKYYILCLTQKLDDYSNPKIQLEYMPIQNVNSTINLPLDTLSLGNSTLYIYDALFSKILYLKQYKANNIIKYLNDLGIDTNIIKISQKLDGRNQACVEFSFVNKTKINVSNNVESVFLPPLDKTVKFQNME